VGSSLSGKHTPRTLLPDHLQKGFDAVVTHCTLSGRWAGASPRLEACSAAGAAAWLLHSILATREWHRSTTLRCSTARRGLPVGWHTPLLRVGRAVGAAVWLPHATTREWHRSIGLRCGTVGRGLPVGWRTPPPGGGQGGRRGSVDGTVLPRFGAARYVEDCRLVGALRRLGAGRAAGAAAGRCHPHYATHTSLLCV